MSVPSDAKYPVEDEWEELCVGPLLPANLAKLDPQSAPVCGQCFHLPHTDRPHYTGNRLTVNTTDISTEFLTTKKQAGLRRGS